MLLAYSGAIYNDGIVLISYSFISGLFYFSTFLAQNSVRSEMFLFSIMIKNMINLNEYLKFVAMPHLIGFRHISLMDYTHSSPVIIQIRQTGTL